MPVLILFQMAPIFTAIVKPTRKFMNVHVISIIQKYFPILADSVSVELPAFKDKYKNSNSRCFMFTDQWEMHVVEEVDQVPHFVLSFDETQLVLATDWDDIFSWVTHIFNDSNPPELYEKIVQLISLPEKIVPESPKSISPPVSEPDNSYSLRYIVDESRNIGVFEVTKPHTDRPYTVIIRNYSARTVLPFFTSLFVCTSWGVTNLDILFLYKVYEHMNLQPIHGDLDLENRLKADIEKCKPSNPGGPEAEPEVYRTSIEELWAQWSNKRNADQIELDPKRIKTLF